MFAWQKEAEVLEACITSINHYLESGKGSLPEGKKSSKSKRKRSSSDHGCLDISIAVRYLHYFLSVSPDSGARCRVFDDINLTNDLLNALKGEFGRVSSLCINY